MSEKEEPLGWNDRVSIPLDTETTLRALLDTAPIDDQSEPEEESSD